MCWDIFFSFLACSTLESPGPRLHIVGGIGWQRQAKSIKHTKVESVFCTKYTKESRRHKEITHVITWFITIDILPQTVKKLGFKELLATLDQCLQQCRTVKTCGVNFPSKAVLFIFIIYLFLVLFFDRKDNLTLERLEVLKGGPLWRDVNLQMTHHEVFHI